MVDLLHQHVRSGSGKCPLIVILPVNVETGGTMVFSQVVLRFRQHSTGTAGGVEKLAHDTRA